MVVPAGPASKVICGRVGLDVIVPPTIVQLYVSPGTFGTEAIKPVAPTTAVFGAVITGAPPGPVVTSTLPPLGQPLASVTTTPKSVGASTVTVIVGVVSPPGSQ